MVPPLLTSPPTSPPNDRRPPTTSLDDMSAAAPPQLDHIPPSRTANGKGPLFLGFDCATQALKVVTIDEALQVVHEDKVEFSEDLPRFGTKSGVLLGEGGVVVGPVEMYVEALDLLMERLKESNFPFHRVASVSGAGQQHAVVLFSHSAPAWLYSGCLSSSLPLASQVLNAFSSPLVTNWQDSSTTAECLELEAALPGGRVEMAQRTGSKAHERFSGPQILKVAKHQPEVLEQTSRIGIVSSWLATMLCLDGNIKGIDESDACGMNLFDIPSRAFDPTLRAAACRSSSTLALKTHLGQVELDPSRAIGNIAKYFVERYGFDEKCIVAPCTGDNPATLLSFALSPGDAIVSLGTSDTVMLASNHYRPSPDYHVFSHPAGDGNDGTRRYMAMLCYKNGSLPRERLRNTFCSPSSWDAFNASILSTPLPASSSITTFLFDKPEIIPPAVHGTHVFRAGRRLEGGEADLTEEERKEYVRRGVESQFLSFRSRVRGVLGGGEKERRLERVFVAGGGSVNLVITGLLSDILGAPVYTSSGSAQGCAIGASYRAAWAHSRRTSPPTTTPLSFDDFVAQSRAQDGMKLVAEPDLAKFEAYGKFLPEWERMEAEVVRLCGEK